MMCALIPIQHPMDFVEVVNFGEAGFQFGKFLVHSCPLLGRAFARVLRSFACTRLGFGLGLRVLEWFGFRFRLRGFALFWLFALLVIL